MLISGVMPTPPASSTIGRSSPDGYVNWPFGVLIDSIAPGRAVACRAFDTTPCRLTEISR